MSLVWADCVHVHVHGLLQDFATADAARVLMESEARHTMVVGGQQLFLDYSSGPPVGGAGPGAPALDWICDMCSAVNFARWGNSKVVVRSFG